MQAVVVIVPVLRRPHRAVPVAESVQSTSPARVLFVVSPNDISEQDAVRDTGCDMLVMDRPHATGDYAKKINAAYRNSTEPLLFCGADDLLFHPGWLEAAIAKLGPGVGVVGTNDLGSPRVIKGEHATHNLVTRGYVDDYGTIDQPGRIFHEGYRHNWCDDELVATAKKRGAWAFAPDSHVEHLHPSWNKGQRDQTYQLGRAGFHIDRRRFEQRRALWT